MPKVVDHNLFLNAVKEVFGDIETITRKQVAQVVKEKNVGWPNWLTNDETVREDWGVYRLKPAGTGAMATATEFSDDDLALAAMAPSAQVVTMDRKPVETAPQFIPDKKQGYVPFGHFSDVRSIIKSGRFYPMYVTGLSGNGKTMMVEQVCAAEKRECIRVNITVETDEDDLLGGFRLQDGKTVWQDGPVIVAMQRGAVLLLDEVDLGSNKLMCLQPVLEGEGVFLKKIGRKVVPTKGFNVVATANTKGKGSDDGRFIGTNVMNEAFLERFSITLEQEYPPSKTEAKILTNILTKAGTPDTDFVDKLVQWAEVVRKAFADGAVSDIISTRRLVHICEAFVIFNTAPSPREKAITMCLARFDPDTKNSFMELYKKVDESVSNGGTTKTPIDNSVAF